MGYAYPVFSPKEKGKELKSELDLKSREYERRLR
jgi:hypothetical protein